MTPVGAGGTEKEETSQVEEVQIVGTQHRRTKSTIPVWSIMLSVARYYQCYTLFRYMEQDHTAHRNQQTTLRIQITSIKTRQ